MGKSPATPDDMDIDSRLELMAKKVRLAERENQIASHNAKVKLLEERERVRRTWGGVVLGTLITTAGATIVLVIVLAALDATFARDQSSAGNWSQVITTDIVKVLIQASLAQAGILGASIVAWAFLDSKV